MKTMLKPRWFAMATACLALAVLFAGCPTSGNSAGSIPAALVGIWVDTTTGIEVLRINANGTGSFAEITGGELRWSVSGNRLTMTLIPDGGGPTTSNTGNWAIVGGRLRLSNWEGPMAIVLNMMIPEELERLGGGAGGGNGATIPVTHIEIRQNGNPVSAIVMVPNQTITLTAVVLPPNATHRAVTWVSSDPSVAAIVTTAGTAVLTANSPGITAVTVIADYHTASVTVAVAYEVTNGTGSHPNRIARRIARLHHI